MGAAKYDHRLWAGQNCLATDIPITQWPLASTVTNLIYGHQFTSNKILDAIESYHWGRSLDGTFHHLEKFYFTKEYGLSRWERCELKANGAQPNLNAGCNGQTISDSFAGPMARIDCRDWTFVCRI